MTNCEWREKTGLFADGELEPALQRAFTTHLEHCRECSGAVLEQQALKKAVRVAGKRFSAPPELYAQVRQQVHPPARPQRWWQLSLITACLMLLAAFAGSRYSRSRGEDNVVAQLMDQHVTMLASSNPVDVLSSDKHTVKPWFQGKVPFTFNPPELAAGSPFKLLGGKLVFAGQSPGAELVYQVRQHRISVFIFPAREAAAETREGGQAFTVEGWRQGTLQYYVVTDAAKEDAQQLRALFEAANRS